MNKKKLLSYPKKILYIRKEIPRNKYIIISSLAFIIFFASWFVLTYGGFVSKIFLPSPTDVAIAFEDLLIEHNLIKDILTSTFRVISAFMLASIIAIPLGIFIGNFKIFEAFFKPFCAFVRYMPATAFIPLLIIWFGIGNLQKISLIFLGTFFHLTLLIADSSSNVPKSYLETALSLGASKTDIILNVVTPACLPNIIDNLRIIMGAAWTYVVVAELVAAMSGLGAMIIESQRFLKTANILVGIIIIGLIGVIFDLLFKLIRKTRFSWAE